MLRSVQDSSRDPNTVAVSARLSGGISKHDILCLATTWKSREMRHGKDTRFRSSTAGSTGCQYRPQGDRWPEAGVERRLRPADGTGDGPEYLQNGPIWNGPKWPKTFPGGPQISRVAQNSHRVARRPSKMARSAPRRPDLGRKPWPRAWMHQGFLGFGVFGTRLGSAFRVVSQKFFSLGGVCNPKPQKPQTWENTPHLTCDTFLQKKIGPFAGQILGQTDPNFIYKTGEFFLLGHNSLTWIHLPSWQITSNPIWIKSLGNFFKKWATYKNAPQMSLILLYIVFHPFL